jgi:hypothetical protein
MTTTKPTQSRLDLEHEPQETPTAQHAFPESHDEWRDIMGGIPGLLNDGEEPHGGEI